MPQKPFFVNLKNVEFTAEDSIYLKFKYPYTLVSSENQWIIGDILT